jgi:hypothetical protein
VELEEFRGEYHKLAAVAHKRMDEGGIDIDSPEPR